MNRDLRNPIADRLAAEHTSQAMLDRVLRGEKFITDGQRDGDFLAWCLSKRHRELTDDIRRVKVEENHKRVDGLVEEVWGDERPVHVHANPGVHVDHVSFYLNEQRTTDWKFAILNPDPTAIIQIICHESRWERIVAALRSRGFWVVNGDAPYTHPSQKWTPEYYANQRIELGEVTPKVQRQNVAAFVAERLTPLVLAGLVRSAALDAVPA